MFTHINNTTDSQPPNAAEENDDNIVARLASSLSQTYVAFAVDETDTLRSATLDAIADAVLKRWRG